MVCIIMLINSWQIPVITVIVSSIYWSIAFIFLIYDFGYILYSNLFIDQRNPINTDIAKLDQIEK